MSLLRKMGLSRTPEQQRQSAQKLFDAGDFGSAKLAFERALDKGSKEEEGWKKQVEASIDRCCDSIAHQRIELSQQHQNEGHLDLAREELEGAAEVARSPDLRARAQRLLEEIATSTLSGQFSAASEGTDGDTTREVLEAGWDEVQAQEYHEYGGPFVDALVEMERGNADAALATLEEVASAAEEPRFLLLELGRCRLACRQAEAGMRDLEGFLKALPPKAAPAARLLATTELVQAAEEASEFDAAVEYLQQAVETLDDDPRPYLMLGMFLRRHGHAAEAVEVLKSAADLTSSSRPDWRILQELGMAQADAGADDQAIETLESMVEVFVGLRQLDLPPVGAVTLARAHERQGNPRRAADLFHTLARGSDAEARPLYYMEAGRLLLDAQSSSEADPLLRRAEALASEELKPQIQAQLARLADC